METAAVMGQRVVVGALAEDPLEAVQGMTLEPMARPTGLGPREVLVEVRAAAVGWVDLIMASGQYQHVPAPPYTPGLEYGGVVAEVGADVEGGRQGRSEERPRHGGAP